jgi:replicative DNA helicase
MNPTTEKTLLGALVLSEKAVQVGDGLGLSSSWFVAGSKPASIFAALCRVRERGEPVDIVTVQLECGEEWAARYLQDCVDAVGLSSHAPAYVRAAATEHARLTAGLMAQAFADAAATTPAGEVSSWIADFAESLRGVLPPAEEGEGVDAVCQRVIGELKNSKTVGLPWPWADIGQTIGNVRQDIIIIQGDRGAGKTAFNFVSNVARPTESC